MNIATTTRRAPIQTQAKAAAAQAQEAAEASAEEAAPSVPTDGVSISVPIPRNMMKRSVSTGLGAAGGLGISFLMGGGLTSGLALGALALGGAAGAFLSSDTVGNAVGSLMAARKEKQVQQKVAAESGRLAEQMLQTRIQEQAEQKFESKWADSGEALVASRVEAQVAQRVEAEAAPRVAQEFGKKFEAVVSERVEEKLKAESERVESEVGTRVQATIDQMVSKAVEEKAAKEVSQLVDASVKERVESALKDRGQEIEGKVESGVQAAIDAQIKAKLEARNAPGSQAKELDIHHKLAVANNNYIGAADILKDGLEIVAATSESMPAADKSLVKLILDTSATDGWIHQEGKPYTQQSRFKVREQTVLILKKTTEAQAASLNPKSYLEALNVSNNTYDSGRLLMRCGLRILADSGSLSSSEKMLVDKALEKSGMPVAQEYKHLQNILKLLAGQAIS